MVTLPRLSGRLSSRLQSTLAGVRRSVAAAWTPASLANTIQWFDPTYSPTTLNSYPVLVPKETGTLAVPRSGRCWTFDGLDDYADGTTRFNATGNFTFAAWIKASDLVGGSADALGGRGIAKSTSTSAATGDWIVSVLQGGAVCFSRWAVDGVNATGRAETAAGTITTGAWFHVAVTWNGTVKKIYVNGVSQSIVANNTTDVGWGNAPFRVGRFYNAGTYWNGHIKDVLIDDEAYSDAEVLSLYTTHTVPTGKTPLAFYRCEEEKGGNGSLGYNCISNTNHLTFTNITESTFHAADTGVQYSHSNSKGYTLSGSVVIPASLSTPTQDAAGNALGVTGPVAYPATTEAQAFTGDGSAACVALGSFIPPTADFALRLRFKYISQATQNSILSVNGASNSLALFFGNGSNELKIWNGSTTSSGLTLVSGTWYDATLVRSGGNFTLTINGASVSVAATTQSASTYLMQDGASGQYSPSWICGVELTTGGKTYYPLFDQCGPGSANTNRDFHIMCSDGTSVAVPGGIVGGTIANIYANRCPMVQDWCINYGGGIAANGSFIPGRIGSALDAAGNAKTLVAGKHGNPYSRVVPNVWNAPALVNGGVDSTDKLAPSATYESITTATDDAFSRHAADGTDRYFATLAALTGSDLTNADAYTA